MPVGPDAHRPRVPPAACLLRVFVAVVVAVFAFVVCEQQQPQGAKVSQTLHSQVGHLILLVILVIVRLFCYQGMRSGS